MLRSFSTSRSILATGLFLGSVAASYAQYGFIPVSPAWNPDEILTWSSTTDPDAPRNRSSVPLATRFTAPTAVQNAALSSLWNVNPHARPNEGRVQAVTTFNTIPAGGTHGWRTNHLYAPGMWQYTDSLVLWGTSDRNTKAILAPTAHTIDAAHRNGVRIYGKIFFNWNAEPDNTTLQRVRDLLVKSDNTFPVADKLIEAAVYYGFDGWFINQENYQTNATDAQNMRDFLVYFRQKAAAVGAPHLRITWYDAMADNGSRSFQNALNANNDGYLKTSEGNLAAHDMFLNFWWYYSSTSISGSRTFAQGLGLNPYDVHAGIWTENNRTYGITPGNGGPDVDIPWSYLFPEGQPHHTSVALFGSETPFVKGKNPAGTTTQDQLFWSGPNSDPSNTAVTGALPNWNGLAHYIPANSSITSLPFITNFNAGQGTLYKIDGTTRMTGPWTNLSVQDILPTWRWIVTTTGTKLTPSIDFTEAYYGGSSLKVTGALAANVPQELKLYQTRLPVDANTKIQLIFKNAATNAGRIEIGYAFEEQPGTMYYTTPATGTLTNWSPTSEFSLGAHAGKTLALITLRFSSTSSIGTYTANIGRLQVRSGTTVIPAAPSTLTLEGTATNPNEALATSMRMKWTASPDPVLHYNVYYRQNLSPATDNQRVWLGATPIPYFFAQEVRRIGSESEGYIQIEAVSPSYGVSSSVSSALFTFNALPNLHHPVIASYPVASPVTVIGSSTNSNIANAFDNNLSTHAEPGGADNAWVGLDLGEGNEKQIVAIRFAPRTNWISRIINGVFQGSNTADFSTGVVQLAKVDAPPPEGAETTLLVTNTTPFRYLRYLSPGGGFANISEIKFYAAGDPVPPAPPTTLQATTSGTTANLTWVAPTSGIAYGYNIRRATSEGGPYTEIADNIGTTSYQDTGLVAGATYHYLITSENEAGESGSSVRLTVNPPAATKLTGTVFGFGTEFVNGATTNAYTSAFDGLLNTYFESSTSQSWTAMDLGATNTKIVKAIRYSPRNSSVSNLTNANFMIGGRFQVANAADFSDAVTLFTIPGPPAYSVLTSVAFTPPATAYRYVRYITASGRNANISEFEIYGADQDAYSVWLSQSGLTPGGSNTGFQQDHNNDGIPNGIEYMTSGGTQITASTTSSGINAIIRQDAGVTSTLWVSDDLTHWSEISYTNAADQTNVASGFIRIQAQLATSAGETKKFYQLRFAK